MILDLRGVFSGREEALPVSGELDLSEVEMYGFRPFDKPVSVTGRVEASAGTVRLIVECRAEYNAPCDRCGEACVEKYTVAVERDVVTELAGEEQDHILVVPDMMLELDGLLESEVILAAPTKHLCGENCRGLCPVCGQNLNRGECGCAVGETDPRLKALKNLLN